MSTYAIASAIEKFSTDFTRAIKEKNKIEKDKLDFEREKFKFEKEKFEFNKQQLKQDESSKNNSNNQNIEFECPHHWIFDSIYNCPNDFTRKEKHICAICGEVKTIPIEHIFKT